MTKRRGDSWNDVANEMHSDAIAARLYGPLWPVLADVLAMAPHTDATGLMTLVALCTPTNDEAPEDITERMAAFVSKLRRRRPGTKISAQRWLAQWIPRCQNADAPWTPDPKLLTWVGRDHGRLIWAVLGVVWSLDYGRISSSYDELSAIRGRPRPSGLLEVAALRAGVPRDVPGLLRLELTLEDACSRLATASGLPSASEFDVTLPAALGAVAAAWCHAPAEGAATTAVLVRSRYRAGLSPNTLSQSCRPGTAARQVAEILARLWAMRIHEEPESSPGPPLTAKEPDRLAPSD